MPAHAYTDVSSAFQEQLQQWETIIDATEDTLDNSTSATTEATYRKTQEQLKTLRLEAQEAMQNAQERLNTQKDILKTLGKPPEDGEIENALLTEERNKLNTIVNTIDARLKQAKLVVARANTLLEAIDKVDKMRLRNRLLAREPLPLYYDALSDLTSDIINYTTQFANWLELGFIIIACIVIMGVTIPITRRLNDVLQCAAHIRVIRPMSRIRLVITMIAAYMVFLLRFNFINLSSFSMLEYLIRFAASTSLSVVLFLALGKFVFVNPRHQSDEIGELKKKYDWLWNAIRKLTRIVLLLVPFIALSGHLNLGLYIGFNIFATLTALMLFIWLRELTVYLVFRLKQPQATTQSEQVKPEETLSPIAITLIEPLLALLMVGFSGFFWGVTSEDVTSWLVQYQNGIPVGDIVIDFESIGSSFILFFSLLLFSRVLQWFLSSRVFPYTRFDIGVRDAILAVTGYIGVIIALLSGMGALGLDLSNLAIVAGALSVGIGFGLQAIFSNFVSGLILLFERPVKVGDWVIVGDCQGTIKKIRVRSTEIETFQNSSVIVPNSQLISETVTNWTLHDRVGRVDIGVGVAYGSDVDKVRKILMNVAKANNSVRNYPAPSVFFMNFGDSSLDFELRCFIRNIRDIFKTSSDLRFAVDTAFRENGIEIPFPQRDIHIRSSYTENEDANPLTPETSSKKTTE